jgi:alpha-glucosidase
LITIRKVVAMRQTQLRTLLHRDARAPLTFTGAAGEHFQLTVLDHHLVRVQHCPEGAPRLDRTWLIAGADGDTPRAGRARADLSPFPRPAPQIAIAAGRVEVRTDALQIALDLADGALTWRDAAGRVFAADVPGRAYSYDRASRTVYHYQQRQPGERYFGFGEKSGALDKAGRRLRMMALDALGYNAETGDPLYKHWPFYITYVPEQQIAYGLLYDNLATSVFDLGQEHDNYFGFYRYWQADDGDVDYYLIYGPSIAAVVERLTALIGRPALPPRWSLGYLGSTMAYTDAPNAQEELRRFVDLCAGHDIPCDLFHLSSGYTLGADGKRYVFTWNRDRVPEPSAMTGYFHDAGIHVAANIKPCLLTTHPRYAEVAALGGFLQAATEDAPEVNIFWGGPGSHLDFTSPVAYGWWQENVRRQLLDYGIDSTWNDNNEYGVWDDDARCHGFGTPQRLSQLRPVQTLLMVRASWEAQVAAHPDERPFVLTRAGCPGVQRYAQTWSGDNATSWHTLRWNIPMGLGMGLSGLPNHGHDVGGFWGDAPDPELFLRWVQHGIFQPRFTIHSWRADGTANEPWMHPEVLPLVRAAMQFRYRLIPYLYTLLHQAAQTGAPITRPFVYAFPDDPAGHTESFDFMLGPSLLVASILEPEQRARPVYLPAGQRWCDFYTGAWQEGGQTITAAAPLSHIPLFAPAGAMLPLGNAMRHVGAAPDQRTLLLFPDQAGAWTANWVEDDGHSLAYQRGEVTTVTAQMAATADAVTVQFAAAGGYALPYAEITVSLPPGDARLLAGPALQSTWRDADGRRHGVYGIDRGFGG